MGDALPDTLDFGDGLYRGDTYVWTHYLNEEPLDWAPDTAYTVGDLTHDVGEVYVAGTTCTHQAKTYTCLVDHVSGETFDPTLWQVDRQALGPATDISGFSFRSQYRTDRTVAAEGLAEDVIQLVTDGTDGALRRVLVADQSALLVPTQASRRVEWDLEATLPATPPDEPMVKTLLSGSPKITGDVARLESDT